MDSNHRPPAYQADALTCWAISPNIRSRTQSCFKPCYQASPCTDYFSDRVSSPSTGGDNRDRTDDPLLAKQVLSQLSYTPVAIPFLKVRSVTPHDAPLIRKKCPPLRKHHICFRKQWAVFFATVIFSGCAVRLPSGPQKLNNEKT